MLATKHLALTIDTYKSSVQSNRQRASGCIYAIQFHLHAHHAEYTDTGILGNFL